eukprot:CAMPEP_0182417940 /NCGR_PEP_ID=MMETSP1167-20130531/2402_1 /TAXON_ID=2988 /ORGANISM="Mallomonas Sp, Strain CCMP3275" /LENGTH=312 /DNA_ID=CAMNT_0024591843 /DNA_START=263 /DNA_END=1201 /DNA_ORIENTATION=-
MKVQNGDDKDVAKSSKKEIIKSDEKNKLSTMDSEDFSDPYGQLLNFDMPVEESDLVSTVSIAGDPSSLERERSEEVKLFRPKRERKADDMLGVTEMQREREREKDSDDDWLKDARDVIELQRGYAIWSKRSDVEIQRDIKRAAASKALTIPESVAKIVQLVHLERTYKLGELKKDRRYELGVIDYRKWLGDQRKRTKKDPIPLAKVEVSKRWIKEHPSITGSNANIIMDDRLEPLYGVVMDTAGKTGGGVMKTNSMLNWELNKEEYLSLPLSLSLSSGTQSGASEKEREKERFQIDGEDVFVVSNEEYFVVI